MERSSSGFRQKIIEMTKNPMMSQFNGERIVERLTEKDLIKIQKIMKKHPSFTITTFLRIFRNIMNPTKEEDFYLSYGLFRLFQEGCLAARKNQLFFTDISTIITQKMPSTNQQVRLSQKLYPLQLQIPQNIKKKIFAPQVIGKILQERQRLEERPYLSDRLMHLNRRVAQSFYSSLNRFFISIDYPSTQIRIMNSEFQLIKIVQTQQQISKRDSIVTWLTWSEEEQKLAALLGNYSISFWAKQDNFRYQVNVPLSISQLHYPYIMIGYMESSKKWYAIDNHPSIYILSNYNYEIEHKISHFKMIKQKQSQKILTLELRYRRLLCVAFQRNIFLISLQKKQIITQLRSFKTSITSIAFSQSFQALFVSNFQNYFTSYQLSEHQDFTEKGKFEGHKNLITLVGILQNRPVVYSIDEKSMIKLWDIRDFTCYQTFYVLKNIQFRQALTLPQSVCLIGSKHFCYRWQRFNIYQQIQKVLLVTQLQKNILIVTSKEVRVYSHSNGVLLKVLKGVFAVGYITFAYLIQVRKIIFLINDDGQTKIYSTNDFVLQANFHLPPKPHYFFYQKQTELLTISCMGQIRICQFKQLANLPLKRRIHNRKQIIKQCQISPIHDLIVVQFQFNHNLFFYSYERAKSIGFLVMPDIVKIQLMGNKNIIFVLCKYKLYIFTFKKHVSQIIFFQQKQINLWQPQDLQLQNIKLNKKNKNIQSTDFIVFEDRIIISSTDALFQCQIVFQADLIDCKEIKLIYQNYNPYRIASEDHLQAFDMTKPALIVKEEIKDINFIKVKYFKYPGNRQFKLMCQINLFYGVVDEHDIIFYDQYCQNKAIINFKETLPLQWDFHNYSEEEFKQLQFVYDFIQQEKSRQSNQQSIFKMTYSSIELAQDLITMSMLIPTKSKHEGRSMSLRQKKMVLEKQRNEKQKQENFLQIRKGQQLIKMKQFSLSTNQKYISQSLAFLNVNRNKLLLNRGANDHDLPQIKALQIKLNSVINKDQKKSIISKISGGYQQNSPIRKATEEQLNRSPVKSINELKLIRQYSERDNFKDRLKRLDLSLRQSKFNHKRKSGSLPLLKKM